MALVGIANKSQLSGQALQSIGGLYEVERNAKEMSDEDRWRLRQETAVPIAEKLHEWMLAERELVPEGSATVFLGSGSSTAVSVRALERAETAGRKTPERLTGS